MLLNGAVLNGAVLNGGPFTWVEGAADIAASAELSADITYVFRASANVSSGEAAFVAEGVRLHPAEAVFDCPGDLVPDADQRHAGGAALSGTANITVFVERVVLAEATITGTSELFVVAQGFFVNADIVGTGDLVGDLNYIHAGTRTDPAVCTAEISATAIAYRMPTASISGTADLYAEYATVAGGFTTYYPYRTLDCTAELTASATCTKVSLAAPAGAVEVGARAHLVHRASASMAASAVILEAEAIHMPLVGVLFTTCTASFDATAERVVLPVATAEGTSEIVASVLIKHAASANSINGGVELAATGLVIVPAYGAMSGTAEVVGAMIGYQYGVANCASSAEFVADGVNLFKVQAVAEVAANSEFVAEGVRLVECVGDIDGSADVSATARTNMEVEDPPERTMYRPYVDREMRRPFVDREMRAAA